MPATSVLFPVPAPIKPQATVFDLKERLDWGEPALTIIDIRSRDKFNDSHITGAILVPVDELTLRVSATLEYERDIYIYGETNEQAAQAAAQLRAIGFENVAELTGGLDAWKAAKGAIEGYASL